MKKLLLLLLSLFFVNPPTVLADEFSYNEESLRNFEVLDMSIGDNLLDFMPEVDIFYGIEQHINTNRYSNRKEPHKFLEIEVPKQEHYLYDGASVFIKNTIPRDYTIYGLRGYRYYIEDFDACIKRRNQIVGILTNFFPDAETGSGVNKDNKSISDTFSIGYPAKNRIIDVFCTDLEETYRLKNKFNEGLSFIVRNKEFSDWILD
tara:strand:+ start:38 stop:652 length:615 start_codon:yes stop_codon:yes gene_type:complete